MTQGLRKKLLPTLKSRRRLGARLAEGREKALRSLCSTVVAPPDRCSPGSARSGSSSAPHPPRRSAVRRQASGMEGDGNDIGEHPDCVETARKLTSWS